MQRIELNGAEILSGYLSPAQQRALVEDLRDVAALAPFRQHVTPSGKKMSVRLTAAGDYGWVSDRSGYRYEPRQFSGEPWPPIPPALLSLWRELADCERSPQCCLVNFYGQATRMGLHQDRDEKDFSCPVLSISLGDEAQFRVGGPSRSDPTRSVWLKSGDIALLRGPSRLAYHGIDKIRFGSSSLLPHGGRINVTLRVVD
jgi:alkylated DNA repair protein (DNA oxidative demethylase)